jgi:DNA-binding XRE family transcriptional regulator
MTWIRKEELRAMKRGKRSRLEAAGWKIGSVAEFLGLDAVEAAIVELRLVLGRSLKERRLQRRLTQAEVARRIGSSQSRVAKMESADASVSLDLMIRSLLALRTAPREIAALIERAGSGT